MQFMHIDTCKYTIIIHEHTPLSNFYMTNIAAHKHIHAHTHTHVHRERERERASEREREREREREEREREREREKRERERDLWARITSANISDVISCSSIERRLIVPEDVALNRSSNSRARSRVSVENPDAVFASIFEHVLYMCVCVLVHVSLGLSLRTHHRPILHMHAHSAIAFTNIRWPRTVISAQGGE